MIGKSKFKFKVGDRVVYANPVMKNHEWNGQKATVLKVVPVKDYEDKNWHGYDSSYSVVVEFDKPTSLGDTYVPCVFKLDNSYKIKERLGIK